jgi:hypothetical protein
VRPAVQKYKYQVESRNKKAGKPGLGCLQAEQALRKIESFRKLSPVVSKVTVRPGNNPLFYLANDKDFRKALILIL